MTKEVWKEGENIYFLPLFFYNKSVLFLWSQIHTLGMFTHIGQNVICYISTDFY